MPAASSDARPPKTGPETHPDPNPGTHPDTDDSSRVPPRAEQHRRGVPGWARTLLEVTIALTVLALVQAFAFKAYQIPSSSMEQTLMTGDRIVVNRLDNSVERGDIVVFEHGDTWETTRRSPSDNPVVNVIRVIGSVVGLGPSTRAYTVKRIIGTGGETVACCDEEGRVTVDGEPLDEPYLGSNFDFDPGVSDCSTTPKPLRCFPDIVVPDDSLFMVGDNRTNSADSVMGCRGLDDGSSCARFVRVDQVVGPVVGRFWPPTQIGGVD